MRQLLLLLGTIGPILAQVVHNVHISRGIPYKVESTNYPELMEAKDGNTIEWNLSVDNDAKVKLVCTKINMVSYVPMDPNNCQDVYLGIEDGRGQKKICTASLRSYFIYLSDGPKLKLNLHITSKGTGMISCTALNTGELAPVETIKLDPYGSARLLNIQGNVQTPFPNLDNLWVLESPPGTRMSIQCSDVALDDQKPICGWNSLKFNNGETEEEFCGHSTNLTWFSKENKAKLRFQLDNHGHGRMTCIIQAITGPSPNQYNNVIFKEVDSSEHGVTPGEAQTSCKCGWTNKGNARIYFGKETRVNEFPWMVHIYVNHETGNDIVGTTCGASIITPRHILTAAHCVVREGIAAKPENIKMELGKHDLTKPTGKEILIGAQRVFIRDIYMKEGIYSDDIALIFTKETIDFSTPIVGPICIEKEEYSLINRHIKIMGWGETENSPSSDYLRKGFSVVMDPLLCGAQRREICTRVKPSSVCSGDSGGPLVWLDPKTNRYSQVALVSRGYSCKRGYMVSTLVPFFYDWIQEVIKETEPSLQTCHKI